MIATLIVLLGALAGLVVPDVVAGLTCSAPNNLPCRPLTLECLVAAAGGLGVAWPAISNDPAVPPEEPYDEGSRRPDRNEREYAPEPPPGYQPPPPGNPADALNDPGFKQAKEDWARQNSDRFPTIPDPEARDRDSVYDTIIRSIQNKEGR